MIRKEEAQKQGIITVDGNARFANDRQTLRDKLRELLPSLVNSDGHVDVKALRDMVDVANSTSNDQGYELTFAGKGIARAKADSPTGQELKTELAQSKDFDNTSNVVIRGDNLDVLKVLYQNYFGKVKMIYIDPPYNTKSDEFVYKDNFKQSDAELIEQFGMNEETSDFLHNVFGTRSHSGWLAFMYPRLKLARQLLREDGVIFISIDDNEAANLKIICDEIFGEHAFIGNIAWESKTKSQNTRDSFDKLQPKVEHIFCYSMQEKSRFNLVTLNRKEYPHEDENGVFRYKLVEQTSSQGVRQRESMVFPIKGILPPEGRRWKYGADTIRIFEKRSDIVLREAKPYMKMRPADERAETTEPFWAFFPKEWGTAESAKKELSHILDSPYHGFETVKPLKVLKRLIFHATDVDDHVLDFFAGSGTTGDAVMQLNAEDGGNRKFILVQWDEEIDPNKNASAHQFCTENSMEPVISSITLERLNRAGTKIEGGGKSPDSGYKVYSLVPKPKLEDSDGDNLQLELINQRDSPLDTLTNMLCATCKTLDTPVECLVEGALYKADNELYVLGNVTEDHLAPFRSHKINLDGWADLSLSDFLNLGFHDESRKDNLTVVY